MMNIIKVKQFPIFRALFSLSNIFLSILLISLVYLALSTIVTYVHNNIRNTSTISCSSFLWQNENCVNKMIGKIQQAKHFILVKAPIVGSEDIFDALREVEKKGVSVKYIFDENLWEYDFYPLSDEARLWIDTEPKKYKEAGKS